MSKEGLTYQRIIGYLKGMLSNRERHELEKEVMQDAFEEEAFEGLNLLTSGELESDMGRMEEMLDKRISKQDRKIRPILFRMAAALLLLIGLGTVMYLVVFKGQDAAEVGYIAESREADQPDNEREGQRPAGRGGEMPVTQAAPPAPSVLPEEQPLDETSRNVARPVQERKTTSAEAVEVQALDADDQMVTQQYDIAVEQPYQQERMRAAAVAIEQDAVSLAETGPDQAMTPLESYTARVVDQRGNPVSGVTVYEKGMIRGSVTDMNGVFSLAATQPSSPLIFSSVTFRESDLVPGGQVSGMARQVDETLSLKEVVIADAMVVKNSLVREESAGAPSAIAQRPDLLTTFEVTSPVPPGGSLRSFKSLVEKNLDTGKLAASVEQMEDITGRYWIDVTMHINMDGSVSEILFNTTIPPAVTEAYRASIMSLPSWQPALQGNTPVDSEVELRFVLSIE